MAKYIWDEGHIPTIDVHSTKKHDVLREYLHRYVTIVGGFPYHRSQLNLTLIDGFAGGGLYLTPDGKIYDGSPLIFIESTKAAEHSLSQNKNFKLNPLYIFLDSNKCFLQFLNNTLIDRGYSSYFNDSILLMHGEFEHKLDCVIDIILKRPGTANRCIFLLDQYGYSDVTLKSIRRIFHRLPNAEILLNFAVDFLIDYLTDSPLHDTLLKKIGFSFVIPELLKSKDDSNWRFNIQRHLINEVVSQSQAKYFTNFFIKCKESRKSYWLLHLSSHPKARDEMQNIHWSLKNHFLHEGKAGLNMLGYNPKNDGFGQSQDFLFSDIDQNINHNTLLKEIPEAIPERGIHASHFFDGHINQTPSTIEMLKVAMAELYKEKQIRILTKSGRAKKVKAQLNNDDIILIERQKYFYIYR